MNDLILQYRLSLRHRQAERLLDAAPAGRSPTAGKETSDDVRNGPPNPNPPQGNRVKPQAAETKSNRPERTTLGVMALYLDGNKLEELSYFRKLTVVGRKRGVQIVVFTPEDVDAGGDRVLAWIYDVKRKVWLRRQTPIPKLIFDRCRFQPTPRFEQLQKFRSRYPHLLYLNRPIGNKWRVHQLLAENADIRPHLPETAVYESPRQLKAFLRKHAFVYLKPANGTGGRGIMRVDKLPDGRCLLQGRDRKRTILPPRTLRFEALAAVLSPKRLDGTYLLQQGIPLKLDNGRVYDFRLLIQKNGFGEWEVTGTAGRIGAKQSITANLHGGGRAADARRLLMHRFGNAKKPETIMSEMSRFSHLVAAELERSFGRLCELALDLGVSPDGTIWLLEVNPKPAREVFRQIGNRNAYLKALQQPIEYALWLKKQQGS